jgi:hypothetical protein
MRRTFPACTGIPFARRGLAWPAGVTIAGNINNGARQAVLVEYF